MATDVDLLALEPNSSGRGRRTRLIGLAHDVLVVGTILFCTFFLLFSFSSILFTTVRNRLLHLTYRKIYSPEWYVSRRLEVFFFFGEKKRRWIYLARTLRQSCATCLYDCGGLCVVDEATLRYGRRSFSCVLALGTSRVCMHLQRRRADMNATQPTNNRPRCYYLFGTTRVMTFALLQNYWFSMISFR